MLAVILGDVPPLVGNGVVCLAVDLGRGGVLTYSGGSQGDRRRGDLLAGGEVFGQMQHTAVDVVVVAFIAVDGDHRAAQDPVALLGLQGHIDAVVGAGSELAGLHRLLFVVATLFHIDQLVDQDLLDLGVANHRGGHALDVLALLQTGQSDGQVACIGQQRVGDVQNTLGVAKLFKTEGLVHALQGNV